MPGMGGFELLDEVKKKYPKIATIMMTGMNDSQMIRKSTLHGADEYITKPFKREELSMVIERAIWRIMPIEPVAE
jgi:FixJ family two-component response regulator